jgi:CRP-like cAMP-binding protein
MRRYRAGTVLLRQDAPGSYVLALTEGRVMVTRTGASGEELIMALGDAGEVLGDMTVLDEAPRSATVTALTPCTVHVMSSEHFRALIHRHGAADTVARHAFARLREAERARFEMNTLPVTQRVARALVRLTATPSVDSIGLSQEQLARLVGASRNAVVDALVRLRGQGIISTSRRHLVICKPAALRALAMENTPRPGDARAV